VNILRLLITIEYKLRTKGRDKVVHPTKVPFILMTSRLLPLLYKAAIWKHEGHQIPKPPLNLSLVKPIDQIIDQFSFQHVTFGDNSLCVSFPLSNHFCLPCRKM